MNEYDVIVIGAGWSGRRVARELAEKLKVAIVTLNDDAGTVFGQTVRTLSVGHALEDPIPHGPTQVDTYRGHPFFSSKDPVLTVGDDQLKAKHFVIATGALPHIPKIQGLDEVQAFTPISIFKEPALPKKVLVIGDGPVGSIIAERLAEQKSSPTLISNKEAILPREEKELRQWFQDKLSQRGVDVRTETQAIQIRSLPNHKIQAVFEKNQVRQEEEFDALILACGFQPHAKGFGFENQGVYIDGSGRIKVDDLSRTAAPHVWACGAVTGFPYSLALSDYQAELVIHNITALFFNKIRMEEEPFPTSFPTKPPFAKVGLSESEASSDYADAQSTVYRMVDRRQSLENPKETGLIKIIGRKKSGQILGVHIVGPCAEELILYFNLAKRAEISLFELLDRQHYPSPTVGDAIYYSIRAWTKETGL